MNPAARLKPLIIAAFGVSLAFVLALLFTVEGDSFKKLQNLSERVASFDKQRLQQEFAEKSLDVIAPLARQAEESGLDIEDQVKAAARDSAIKALFVSGRLSAAPSKANAKARPETVQQALDRIAAGKQGRWISAVITDKDGWVVAWWPADKKPAKELKADPFFVSMKSGAILTETPVRAWEKAPSQGALGKDGKPVPGSKGGFDSLMAVACGIEDASQNFAGLIRVAARAEGLFGLDPSRSFKSVRELSPKSSVILQRGNGDQVLNSAKGPYTENSSGIPDLKDLMAAMQAKASGWVALKSYDGKPALAAWRRVGSWSESQGGANLFSLLAVFPDDDVKAAGAAGQADKPRHFYARPLVLLLLLLAIALPLGLLLVLLPSRLDPLRRMLQVAGQIDEFGAVPEGLEFREEQDGAFAKVNLSLNALLKRAAANEHRAHELDAALRRVEDQASRDATIAAQELSELRSRVGGADSEKAAANAKFEAAQKARAEAEAQLGNLKSALETAQRSIDLKNSENKNLSAQIQDLMRSLEEQRKVAQQVQENTMRRDDELVRLSAVNTLSSELKATLTVIKNYISTMLGSVGAISDAQQEFLGVVINKSARLERLIADLVELSEIGSGIKPPRLETISAGSMVQEALLNTRPQADHKKIALEFAESGNVPQVSVDKERIGAIIRALLSQAVKVTSRGERVSILVGARENNVELRFSDPGMSLPPDRAAKVFNQFHGVDSQAGPEFIGTGLRFPIMRAIVEAHGGKVWIESQVGRGKTFVISIPKAGSFAPAAPRPAGAAAPSMPMMPPDAAPPAGTMPALPASKPTQGEVAKFDSIFGEMPVGAPPKPAFNPPPPPAAAPLAPPMPPAGLAGLPSLPSLPSLPPLPGLPPLAPPPPAPALKPLGPPPAPGAVPAPPAPVSFKTEAAKSPLKDEDKSNFDAIFGGLPPQVADAPKPGGLPKVELKTGAALADADKSNFDAIFGGGAPKPVGPPPAPGAVPAPPRPAVPADLSNFDAIFGGGAAPAPPKPVGPPPAPGAVPAPPPQAVKPAMPPAGTLPADLSNFDAIFGSGPPPAPPKKEGGLNTMDDLKNMLGG